MNLICRNTVLLTLMSLAVCFSGGCGRQRRADRQQDFASAEELGTPIGSLVEVVVPEPIPVEGIGVVAGLKGTGSAECPPQVRDYLTQYILKHLPAKTTMDADKLINSLNTAVVSVQGVIPEIASKNHYFDVKVSALPSTQTTSLDGGRLFTAELKMLGSFGINTRILADAQGPIYIDKIDNSRTNRRTGYILAGGKVLNEYKIILSLYKPDFEVANRIRNRINGRFGENVAKAIISDRIELSVPPKYKQRKQRFISLVKAMFLAQEPAVTGRRIEAYIKRLTGSKDKYSSEVALEAIGNECLDELDVLLDSPDEKIRFHAARCMLNLGSDNGLATLRRIAQKKGSAYRIDALESIAFAARRNDAVSISRRLLRDDDFRIRLAAYEQLRKLDDIVLTQEFIGGNFYLERVSQTDIKTIYVSRSGQPRFVLFGGLIYSNGNIFVQSEDGDVIINAPAGQQYVNIIRKHPKRPGVITQLKSSFEIGDIIRTLCDEPVEEDKKERLGLGVSYADAAALLKQMCDKGVVGAEFHAGAMPKIDLNIKK